MKNSLKRFLLTLPLLLTLAACHEGAALQWPEGTTNDGGPSGTTNPPPPDGSKAPEAPLPSPSASPESAGMQHLQTAHENYAQKIQADPMKVATAYQNHLGNKLPSEFSDLNDVQHFYEFVQEIGGDAGPIVEVSAHLDNWYGKVHQSFHQAKSNTGTSADVKAMSDNMQYMTNYGQALDQLVQNALTVYGVNLVSKANPDADSFKTLSDDFLQQITGQIDVTQHISDLKTALQKLLASDAHTFTNPDGTSTYFSFVNFKGAVNMEVSPIMANGFFK